MDDIGYLIISIVAWLLLGVLMYVAFIRMQISERETELAAEEGKTPLYEAIGSGAMNGARPVRNPYARFTLYDTFFAACFKTQRKAVEYKSISTLEFKQYHGKEWLYIKTVDPDHGGALEILFLSENQAVLHDQILLRQKAS